MMSRRHLPAKRDDRSRPFLQRQRRAIRPLVVEHPRLLLHCVLEEARQLQLSLAAGHEERVYHPPVIPQHGSHLTTVEGLQREL